MRRAVATCAGNTRKAKGTGHERRSEILAAARELFAKEGYETVTTRRLAQHVGISQTALYLYFDNKDAIYDAVCQETFFQLTEALERVAAPDAETRLAQIIEAYIRFGLAHPDEYRLTFMVMHPRLVASHVKDLSLPIEQQGPGMRCFLRFRDQIAMLTTHGKPSTELTTLVAQTVLVAAHGLVAFLIARPWYPWVERGMLVDGLVRTLVAGLLRVQPSPDCEIATSACRPPAKDVQRV